MQSAKYRIEGVADLVDQFARDFDSLVVLGGGHGGPEFLPGELASVVRGTDSDGICADPFGRHNFGALDGACSERCEHSDERRMFCIQRRVWIQRGSTGLRLKKGEGAVAPGAALDGKSERGGNIDAVANIDAVKVCGHDRSPIEVIDLQSGTPAASPMGSLVNDSL